MPKFQTDSLVLRCSNVDAAKQWWIEVFNCKQAKLPEIWDDLRPSDVALKLPGDEEPTILLADRTETREEQLPPEHPILFCDKLKEAHEYFLSKGLVAGPIQDRGGTEFFDIRDPDGNVIEICKEP